ncbi:MAG: hypothetical protein AAGB33_00245 [Cellulomonas sp.]|nr:hypothetical protein [Rickettsiella sp.]
MSISNELLRSQCQDICVPERKVKEVIEDLEIHIKKVIIKGNLFEYKNKLDELGVKFKKAIFENFEETKKQITDKISLHIVSIKEVLDDLEKDQTKCKDQGVETAIDAVRSLYKKYQGSPLQQ